jgi:serine/threonine protein phosphatase PrpC
VEPVFASNPDQAFFAVFDGHGKEGHHCAQFAKKHVSYSTQRGCLQLNCVAHLGFWSFF